MRNIISNALKFTRENGIVIINLSIDCKENCNCDNINDDIKDDIRDDIKVDIDDDNNDNVVKLGNDQQQGDQEYQVIDILDDLTLIRSDQNNFDSSVINNDKYFLKMTVKDSGPGITKVR